MAWNQAPRPHQLESASVQAGMSAWGKLG